jgi:hypothetical protein
MALGYQARAMLRGLAKLGEPSLLAGLDCGNVALERNVDVAQDTEARNGLGNVRENHVTVTRTVAHIGTQYAPRVGQTLTHPDGAFVLDRLLEDNGVVRRFVVAAA